MPAQDGSRPSSATRSTSAHAAHLGATTAHLGRAQGQAPGSPGEAGAEPAGHAAADELQLACAAVAVELQRRAAHRKTGATLLTDAELWVEPAEWQAVWDQIRAASDRLHAAARPPRAAGTVRVNATMVLFSMEPDR